MDRLFKLSISLILLTIAACLPTETTGTKMSIERSRHIVQPCPEKKPTKCEDRVMLLNETDLKNGVSCPPDSRTTFPHGIFNQNSVIILCQCKY